MNNFDSDLLGRIMDDIWHHKFERTSFKHIKSNKDRDKNKTDTISKNYLCKITLKAIFLFFEIPVSISQDFRGCEFRLESFRKICDRLVATFSGNFVRKFRDCQTSRKLRKFRERRQ